MVREAWGTLYGFSPVILKAAAAIPPTNVGALPRGKLIPPTRFALQGSHQDQCGQDGPDISHLDMQHNAHLLWRQGQRRYRAQRFEHAELQR